VAATVEAVVDVVAVVGVVAAVAIELLATVT